MICEASALLFCAAFQDLWGNNETRDVADQDGSIFQASGSPFDMCLRSMTP